MIIGLDFDNTMVDYHALFHRLAAEHGLISPEVPVDKTAIRDHIRSACEGDEAWQLLQGAAYGPRIGEAVPAEGLLSFLHDCQNAGATVYVVSHKTPFAHHDPTGTNLRAAATDWMKKHGLLNSDKGLTSDRVFFEPTRQAKLLRIAALRCDAFVDDLPETLTDAAFPAGTRRILFSARHDGSCLPEITVVPSFAALARMLLLDTASNTQLREPVCSRLVGESVHLDDPLNGGRNNLVYHFTLQDGRERIAKFYFHAADDPRDRLKSEYESLSMLWDVGLRQIPQPLLVDPAHHCAIYTYIEGEDASLNPITPQRIDQAVDFVGLLHEARNHPRAAELGVASEACFSVKALVRNVRQRLESLQRMADSTAEVCAARSLVNEHLVPALAHFEEKSRILCANCGQAYDKELPYQRRTLSPSDFGFHNARITPDGRLVFLDFEYFGWDDPAKLLADFLLHPAMSLSPPLKRHFLAAALRMLGNDGFLRDRLAVVYPLYALKWCTILLNEFLPSHRARRDFAGSARPVCLQTQLNRAEAMLQQAHHLEPFNEP